MGFDLVDVGFIDDDCSGVVWVFVEDVGVTRFLREIFTGVLEEDNIPEGGS